jgi:hypothetical protein
MADDQSCVLSLQNFPRELRRKLKIKAAEREIDLQTLCVKYLESGLARDDLKIPPAQQKK